MKLRILAVGTRMPKWVEQGYQEYSKRLPRECSLELLELNAATRGKTALVERWKAEEAKRLLAAHKPGNQLIALDLKGKPWTTEQLAMQLREWMEDGRDRDIMIGGPDGLDQTCLNQAEKKWSLSPLTLPHPLVRVLLAEQLYRAWTLTVNHPYHR